MLELVDIGYLTSVENSSGIPDAGFDPNTWTGYVMMGATEASGVSAVFAVIVTITTGAVVIFHRANNKPEAEQGGDGDA